MENVYHICLLWIAGKSNGEPFYFGVFWGTQVSDNLFGGETLSFLVFEWVQKWETSKMPGNRIFWPWNGGMLGGPHGLTMVSVYIYIYILLQISATKWGGLGLQYRLPASIFLYKQEGLCPPFCIWNHFVVDSSTDTFDLMESLETWTWWCKKHNLYTSIPSNGHFFWWFLCYNARTGSLKLKRREPWKMVIWDQKKTLLVAWGYHTIIQSIYFYGHVHFP